MKLPNGHLAVVQERKILEYLLSAAHPDNGGKAKFFFAMGFTVADWEVLADALRLHALQEISSYQQSEHGRKFVIDGELTTPIGKRPMVKSIWIIDAGGEMPRLVTAYPLG